MPAKEQLLLGIDIGTTNCTALVITLNGDLVIRAETTYPYFSPQPNWAEQRASDWWQVVVETARKCAGSLDPAHQEIVGIGIDSHLEAFVPVDEQGNALANGLLWLDQRTIPQAEQLKELLPEQWVIETTGVPINYVNPAAKMLWLKQHLPEAYHKARILLAPKDFVIYKITGRAWTDYSIASKTMLYDLTDKGWSNEICQAIDLDINKLPPIQGAWQLAGTTSSEFENLTGIKAGTPLATGGGDDHCQALGGGVVEPGTINIGTGTGSTWKVLLSEPRPDLEGRVECHQNILPDTWIYWTAINATGYSVSWFIKNFGLQGSSEDTFASFETLAETVEPGANGLIFYPHLWGARAPHFNPNATGIFFGIIHTHQTAHFCRAILEGTAFQYLALMDTLADLGARPSSLTMVGGETKNKLWNQIKADVMGRDILIPEIHDGSALGSAMLGGLAVGAFADAKEAVSQVIRWQEPVIPRAAESHRYAQLYEQYSAIYNILEPAYSVRLNQ